MHDDGPVRAAVARLAGTAPSWSGSAADGYSDAPAPDVIVMPIGPHLASAAGAAAQISALHPHAHWILLRSAGAPEAMVRERFAALDATHLRWPPPATSLRRVLARPPAPASGTRVSSRRQRDGLVRRFTRAFGDLDLPNPIANGAPLLIVGEAGTGRLLMARVIHALAEHSSRFLHVAFEDESGLEDLDRRLREAPSGALTLCLDGPERLRPSAQRELRGWVDLGPPQRAQGEGELRFVSLIEEGAAGQLEPELEAVLSGLSLRIPPLRERPGVAARFAADWLAEWGQHHRKETPGLTADALSALAADVWPGNLRELEEALQRAVSVGPADVLTADALGFIQPTRPTPVAAPLAGVDPNPARQATPPGPSGSESLADDALPSAAVSSAPSLAQVARTLSHELGNPMVSLRTFAQLLPERQHDPTFREEFRFQMERDLERISDRLERLQAYADLGPAKAERVDVSSLVEQLLDERRDRITERGLLVLRELEDEHPNALGEADRLRFAFSALLDAAFEAVADRADLYVACRFHPRGLADRPAIRVLVRFHPERAPISVPGEEGELDLAVLLAGSTLEAIGGRLTVDSTEADERVLLIDLPAAPAT